MKHDPTAKVLLSVDDLEHLRWALAGFHQQVSTTPLVQSRAALIDEKLRNGLVFLQGTAMHVERPKVTKDGVMSYRDENEEHEWR